MIVGVGIIEVLSSMLSGLSSHVVSGLEVDTDSLVFESSPEEGSDEDGKSNQNSMSKGHSDVGFEEKFLKSIFSHGIDPRVMEPRLHFRVS